MKVMWQDKGREIESRFKELFQPSQPASKFTKARKPKVQQKKENKELSSYPGSLMREFFCEGEPSDVTMQFSQHISLDWLYAMSSNNWKRVYLD